MKNNVVSLRAKPPPVKNTVRCLEHLLAKARAGHIIGVAFVALMGDAAFISDACGAAAERPESTLHMLHQLEAKLARRL